ncbi:MAG: hypothetical protein KIT51_17615 [Cyclobacteriaceae bacterium]|nr:MAG: hypothetical protein KIT51_17615 [Cyclobacteriaceae bacterium]
MAGDRVAREKLSEKGVLELSDAELKRIQEIKSSKQKVPTCSGCVYWDELPLSDLFDTKNREIISASADYWFDRYYKK